MNDSEGMDPERLKAFNASARLGRPGRGALVLSHRLHPPQMFVRQDGKNLDRMVPISKQPKEEDPGHHRNKKQPAVPSSRNGPASASARTKSCRDMKKNGMRW